MFISVEISLRAICFLFLCLPIKNQPLNYVQSLPEFSGLQFADSGQVDEEIDLLIGSDFYWSLVTGNVRFIEGYSPVAIETKVGWVFSGPIDLPDSINLNVSTNDTHVVFIQNSKTKLNYEDELSKFWDLECTRN